MAVANIETKAKTEEKTEGVTEGMTWEYYMETPMSGRFEIIEGVFYQRPTPTMRYQIYVMNIALAIYEYERKLCNGVVVFAPCDILIRRFPRLQTRQPDVLFTSNEQLARGRGVPERGPLLIGPELVVEIISDSETEQSVNDKISDYIFIGVRELWKVFPASRTVEVVRLTQDGAESVATYDETQSAASITFDGLTVSIAAIFAA